LNYKKILQKKKKLFNNLFSKILYFVTTMYLFKTHSSLENYVRYLLHFLIFFITFLLLTNNNSQVYLQIPTKQRNCIVTLEKVSIVCLCLRSSCLLFFFF
jgi:hypothetical protein